MAFFKKLVRHKTGEQWQAEASHNAGAWRLVAIAAGFLIVRIGGAAQPSWTNR